MSDGRKIITMEMIEAARDRGMNVTQTARYYGFNRKSIAAAYKRFGIALPYSIYSPQKPSPRKATLPKTKAAWSASPAAIERALSRLGLEGQNRGC